MQISSYQEEQRLSLWWLWILLAPVVIMSWTGFVQQIILSRPFGNNPAPDWAVGLIVAFYGIGLPVLLLTTRLRIQVQNGVLRIHYFPFWAEKIDLHKVRSVEVSEFRPLRDWGGWGIRWSPGRGWCYTIGGNRGVQLILTDGRKRLIGSARPEELLAAIRGALRGISGKP